MTTHTKSYMRAYRKKERKRIRRIAAKYRKTAKWRAAKRREVKKRGAKFNKYKRAWRHLKNNSAATRPRPKACECCARPGDLVFDHDHRTGKFRGWLCHECNLGIGKLGDDIHGIKDALAYLEMALRYGKAAPHKRNARDG